MFSSGGGCDNAIAACCCATWGSSESCCQSSLQSMNFMHSSHNSSAYIRRLGAAQQPLNSTHPSVSADAVAAHHIQVADTPHDKKFERQIHMQGRTLLHQMKDKSLRYTLTEDQISAAVQKMKPAIAQGYNDILVVLQKNLCPTVNTWLSKFFSRITATRSIPNIWRKAKGDSC